MREVSLRQKDRLDRQSAAFMKNAKSVKTKPMTAHLEPDLPIEQTFDYQNATPEEQKIMKEEEQKKKAASAAVTLEPIEEGVK